VGKHESRIENKIINQGTQLFTLKLQKHALLHTSTLVWSRVAKTREITRARGCWNLRGSFIETERGFLAARACNYTGFHTCKKPAQRKFIETEISPIV
jgi:hypothetical protein